MNLETLETRRNLLISALENAKREVIDCTEKLERAKSNFTMLTGNLNELSYLFAQEQQEQQEQLSDILKPTEVGILNPDMEVIHNVEINEQSEE